MLLGVSDWIVIEQGTIDHLPMSLAIGNSFTSIPYAPKKRRSAETIAHGLFTLSLVSAMSFTAVPAIAGARMVINYGLIRSDSSVPCFPAVAGTAVNDIADTNDSVNKPCAIVPPNGVSLARTGSM